VLALDYGRARCGVAVSDPTGVIATPREPVAEPAGRRGMGRIVELVRELEVERVVVGLPLSLTGEDSEQTRETRGFAAALERRLRGAVPVELFDERFTTALARRDGVDVATGTVTPPRSSEDSRAAAHLLSSWLERRVHA